MIGGDFTGCKSRGGRGRYKGSSLGGRRGGEHRWGDASRW